MTLIKRRLTYFQPWLAAHNQALVCAALALGVALRLAGLATSAIWYDESISLSMARLPLLKMVQVLAQDFNPPLWELIIWPWVQILGASELAARIIAMLSSVVSLWLTVKITKALDFTPGQTLAAVTLAALLPYQFWMAQDGRVYAVLGALYLAALYFALTQRWWGLLGACGLLLYSHTLGALFALSALLVGHLRDPKGNYKQFITVGLAALAAFLPWLPVLISNIPLYITDETMTLNGALTALVMATWGGALPDIGLMLVALGVMAVSLLFALGLTFEPLLEKRTMLNSPNLYLVVMAMLPLGLLLDISLIYKPMFLYRVIGPSVIPIVLWVSKIITPRRLTKTTWILPAAWALLLIVGLANYTPTTRGGALRDQAQFINGQLQPGDIIYHASATSELPFTFYTPAGLNYVLDEPQGPGLLQTNIQTVLGINRAALVDVPHQRAWIIWAQDPSLSSRAQDRMAQYTQGAALVGAITGWQFSPILIYVKEDSTNAVGQIK